MVKAFPASRCYLDLCFALATVSCREDTRCKEIVNDLTALINRMDYSFVKMNLFK